MKKCFIKILDIMALSIFAVLIFVSMFGITLYQVKWPVSLLVINSIAERILIVVALLKIYIYFDEDREKSLIGFALIAFFIILKLIDQCDYIQVIALIVSMIGIKVDKILKVYISTEGVSLFVTYVSALVGIIPNEYEYSETRKIITSYNLGFTNHNPPMALWLFLMLTLYCLLFDDIKKNKKNQIITVALFMAITTILYVVTRSNTSFLIGMFCSIVIILFLLMGNGLKSPKLERLIEIVSKAAILMPVYSFIFTVLGICFYGKFGKKGMPLATLLHRFEIIYWELKLSGVPMPFYKMREAKIADVDFPFFLNYDLQSGMYENVDFNLFRGLGVLKRGQLFGGSDIEYFNILLFDGLMVLIPYIVLTMYLMYRAQKSHRYVLMLCIACSIFYGNFEALKSGYTVCQIFIVLLLANLDASNKKCTPRVEK